MFTNPTAWFFKFLKFVLVGFSGLLLDFGITYLTREKLRWNKYLANSSGFAIACTNNYLLNRLWTFRSVDPGIAVQFSKFLLIALVGLILNNLLVYLLTVKFKLNFYVAKFCAMVLVFFWNFFFNYLFTFTR
ncbi:GtrA family protein [Adhaeribacter pallidiroseus]|uniref:Dolichyl-phosphate beta-D-mannosyltransferase n=1 Tax=Adhaeribacter pallidiroseus TaxID=2072847 RepID=A0A369QN74_9BACT|nr:GtrA family protein [Adhaeribacter pallidiroseus]RDC64706.1 Dolichyl-phosphate beta-D-mannosyltransferase [Adhaeribacter pallidiroseus]